MSNKLLNNVSLYNICLSVTNSHLVRKTYIQYSQRLNVCAGILGGHIVDPFLLVIERRHLHGTSRYITDLLANDENLLGNKLVFQHFAVPVRELLNDRFPGRWIGGRNPIEWPARSPDHSSIGYFLWRRVDATQSASITNLKQRVIEE